MHPDKRNNTIFLCFTLFFLFQMMCGDPSSTPSTPLGSAPFQFPPSPWLETPGMTPTPVPSECYDFGPDAIDADSLHSIISEVIK